MPIVKVDGPAPTRTTIQLPDALSANLDLYCLETRQGKGQVLREALTEFLRNRQFNPDERPEITYSWANGAPRLDKTMTPARQD